MSLEVVGVNALLIKCSTFLSLISQGEGVWVNLKILFRIQHRVLLLKRSSYHYLVTGNVQAFCFWCKKGLFRVYQPATRLACRAMDVRRTIPSTKYSVPLNF